MAGQPFAKEIRFVTCGSNQLSAETLTTWKDTELGQNEERLVDIRYSTGRKRTDRAFRLQTCYPWRKGKNDLRAVQMPAGLLLPPQAQKRQARVQVRWLRATFLVLRRQCNDPSRFLKTGHGASEDSSQVLKSNEMCPASFQTCLGLVSLFSFWHLPSGMEVSILSLPAPPLCFGSR